MVGRRVPWQSEEEWRKYGVEHGFNERNPSSLSDSDDKEERSWYKKGHREHWDKNFSFDRMSGNWLSEEEWAKHGIERRYDGKNAKSLRLSEDEKERKWYNKGNNMRWAKNFSFDRMRDLWKSLEDWREHGIEMGYDGRNSVSLKNSDDKEERSWYKKGERKEWLKKFDFERKSVSRINWKKKKDWIRHGVEQRYENRNYKSLETSEDKDERGWIGKGQREGWLGEFDFGKVQRRWQTWEEWRKYGIEMGYDKRNPWSFQKSEDKEERSWYGKGLREKWVGGFNFKRKESNWGDKEEWIKYGIERGYDKRNPSSLSNSEDKEERIWYARGNHKKWLGEFDFERINKCYIRNSKQLISFLQQDTTARNLAVAATMLNGEAYDIEKIIIESYSGKFSDEGELHRLLEESQGEIQGLMDDGLTNLGSYIGEYSLGDRSIVPILIGEAIANLPSERVTQSLEERLVRILRNQYSPRFNSNPDETFSEIEKKVNESEGKVRDIYQGLLGYYQEVLELRGELG